MRVLTKRLRLESRCFRYQVTMYLNYLQIKFDDKIKGNCLRISSIRPDSPVSKGKLGSKFGFIYLQPDFAVTEIFNTIKSMATNERVKNRSIRTTERRFAGPQNV